VIVVVGLSHRSAPIDIRERLALPEAELPVLLRELVADPAVGEALVISTCNRVEVVAAARDPRRGDLDATADGVAARLVARAPEVCGHLYCFAGRAAVRHLFRVAASLDSLVVGEPQILGQVKEAYDLAREAGTTGPALHRILPRAIRAAKRVRTETTIGAGQVSVPSVAVDLAAQIFGNLGRHVAALVGSGEMGEAVARLLRQAGAELVVVGRNLERAQELARALGGEGRPMSDLDRTLVEADVVISTTSAPGSIITYDQVKEHRRARRGRSLFFIDLAVPRDVEPRVGKLDGVFLYNIDDLSHVVAESLETREREARRAEEILAIEAVGYDRWEDAEQVTPMVVALRERLGGVLDAELERSLSGKLKHLSAGEREVLARMMEAAVNKMMHGPTVKLRAMASDAAQRGDLEQTLLLLGELFELAGPQNAGTPAPEDRAADPPVVPAPLRRQGVGR
jgi:glutamyl-tRNA reductase